MKAPAWLRQMFGRCEPASLATRGRTDQRLSAAIEARKLAERSVEQSRLRRPRVEDVVRSFEEIRRANHLTQRLHELFEGR